MVALTENIKAPVLRFSEFFGNWENFQLRDQCVLITKGTTPKHFDSSGSVTFVKLEAISDFQVRREKCLSISKAVHEGELKRSILEEGDLLLAIAGATVGKLGLVQETILPANTNQALAIIRTKDNFQSFLIHQMQSPLMFKYIGRCVAVGAQPNLSLKQVGEYPVCIPLDLREQQKIAEFLTSVDERISKLKRKKELLEEYKRGMMQKLFSQEIRFKDDDGSDFPDWEEKRIGQLFAGLKGKGLSKADLSPGGAEKCILYGDLYTMYGRVIGSVYSATNVKEGMRSKKGDLLVPCSTTTTAKDLATASALNEEGVLLGGDISVLRPKSNAVTSIFYSYALTNFYQKKIARLGQGTTIIHLYYSHFSRIHVCKPSISEQLKITEFLMGFDDKISAVANQIDKAAEFKRGLLQKMFV